MPNMNYFSLDGFANVSGDLADEIIGEAGEFAPHSYAKNDVSNHTGSAKISTPGGDKERPSARPEGGEFGPTPPGGFRERPTGKPVGGEFGPSTPKKVELTTDEWNKAMAALKHSFKEGVEIMDMLEQCRIVEETVDDRQNKYMEELMQEAAYEALINGPIFEAAKDSDKAIIRGKVKKLNRKVRKYFKDKRANYKPVQLYANLTKAGPFRSRLWQYLGVAWMDNPVAKRYATDLTEIYKDILGEYKILPIPCLFREQREMFIKQFKWDKNANIIMFIIDKKIPMELTKRGQLSGSYNSLQLEAGKNDDDDDTEESDVCPECGKDPCECDDNDDKDSKKKSSKKKSKDEDDDDDDISSEDVEDNEDNEDDEDD